MGYRPLQYQRGLKLKLKGGLLIPEDIDHSNIKGD